MMRDSHPGDFERILEIRGRKLPYFSRAGGELNLPRPIGDTGIFASCHGTGALIAGRARRVVEHFGHPAGSLETISKRSGDVEMGQLTTGAAGFSPSIRPGRAFRGGCLMVGYGYGGLGSRPRSGRGQAFRGDDGLGVRTSFEIVS